MPADAPGVVASLLNDLSIEFGDRVTPESLRALIDTELSRWQECTIRDFVPIFVGRHVRAELLTVAEDSAPRGRDAAALQSRAHPADHSNGRPRGRATSLVS